MDTLFHSRVGSTWWKSTTATKNATVCCQDYGMHILGCWWCNIHRSSWRGKISIANIIWSGWGRIREKTAPNERQNSNSSPRQWTVSQVVCNYGKNAWIVLQIASATTIISRFSPQQLLPIRNTQRNDQKQWSTC